MSAPCDHKGGTTYWCVVCQPERVTHAPESAIPCATVPGFALMRVACKPCDGVGWIESEVAHLGGEASKCESCGGHGFVCSVCLEPMPGDSCEHCAADPAAVRAGVAPATVPGITAESAVTVYPHAASLLRANLDAQEIDDLRGRLREEKEARKRAETLVADLSACMSGDCGRCLMCGGRDWGKERAAKEKAEAEAEVERLNRLISDNARDESGRVAMPLAALTKIDAAREAQKKAEAERDEALDDLELFAQAACGLAFDTGIHNRHANDFAVCAFCLAEYPRNREAMRAHMEACEKHPMAAMRKERDAALVDALHAEEARQAAQEEESTLRAQLEAAREALKHGDCCQGNGFGLDGTRIHMQGCPIDAALAGKDGG